MDNLFRLILWAIILGVSIFAASHNFSYANTEFNGCYQTLYNKSQFEKHKGQIVFHVYLEIEKANNSLQNEVFDAKLSMWVKEYEKKQFMNYGSCMIRGEELMCNGSLSGSAALPCLKEKDGVTSTCRNFAYDNGKFKIERRSGTILVSLIGKLELVEKSIPGEHLYLSQSNRENSRFILSPTECGQIRLPDDQG